MSKISCVAAEKHETSCGFANAWEEFKNGRGSKSATKFHTLEKAVLERDKNTNMRKQNRYILYIISFMVVLSLLLAGMRLVYPEHIGNGRSGEQTESKLKGQSGETDQNIGMEKSEYPCGIDDGRLWKRAAQFGQSGSRQWTET